MQIPVTTSGRIHPYHPNMRPRLLLRAGIRRVLILILAAVEASAQESINNAILTNKGQPIRVAYGCAEQDLEWAGMSCGDDAPCAIYLELSSIFEEGGEIFVSGDLHSSSATLSSILLRSDDSGATWKEPA